MGEQAVTAVDVLLEPDAALVERATALNQRLLASYPDGFALDEAHRPHVTLIQQFVRTERLEEFFGVVEKVLDAEPSASWLLRAHGYFFSPSPPIGVGGILIRPTADLIRIQRTLLDVVAPFVTASGGAEAFVRTSAEPVIEQSTIDYVATFERVAAGEQFSPHLTAGLGRQEAVDELMAEPFDELTVTPIRAAAYQIGNFGTAAKLLHAWDLRR
jgi:hypothetical protein